MDEQLLEIRTLEKQLEMSLKQYNDLSNKDTTTNNIENLKQLNNTLTMF